MYRITKTEISGGLVIATVEDEDTLFTEKLSVAKEFFAPLSLAEGDRVGDAEYDGLRRAASLSAAYAKALDALSYSSMSRRALSDKLRLKYKFDRETAEEAAEYVARRGFLNEASQAERAAENAARTKLWGRRRIVSKLCSKGYPRECAEEAADAVGKDVYRAALMKLIDKKAKSAPESREEYSKLIAALIRYGHGADEIKRALTGKFGN